MRDASLPALLAALREAATRLAGDSAWSGRPGGPPPICSPSWRRRRCEGPERIEAAHLPDMLERLMRGRGGAPALRPASAHRHLGPARGAAAACRSAHPRRAERRRLARLARARSLAGAADPRRARPALARAADRPRRARFRDRARRPPGAGHPRPPRRPLARDRLALLAAAGGDDRRPHPRARTRANGRGRSTGPASSAPAERPAPAPDRGGAAQARSR